MRKTRKNDSEIKFKNSQTDYQSQKMIESYNEYSLEEKLRQLKTKKFKNPFSEISSEKSKSSGKKEEMDKKSYSYVNYNQRKKRKDAGTIIKVMGKVDKGKIKGIFGIFGKGSVKDSQKNIVKKEKDEFDILRRGMLKAKRPKRVAF